VYIAKASGVDAAATDGMCASGIKLCFFRSHFLAQGVLKALNNLIVFLFKKKKVLFVYQSIFNASGFRRK
jgi:hypothetical protein